MIEYTVRLILRSDSVKKLISLLISFIILISGLMTFSVSAQELCVMGDVTFDGVVSIADAYYVLRAKNNYNPYDNEYDILGDLDYNAQYTESDVYEILKIASGIESCTSVRFNDWTLEKSPTCEENGYYASYCETQNITRYRSIKANGHSVANGVCETCGEQFADIDSICVYNKNVKFGDSESTVKAVLGNPTEILSDKTDALSLTYYIYAQDYSKLSVFTFAKGKGLISFYTNDTRSTVKFTKDYSISSYNGEVFCENNQLVYYVDGIGTKKAYAMFATKYMDTFWLYPNSDFSANSKLIFHTSNGCRAINGLSALKYDDKLCKMALYHSEDMATNNYFSHDAPNGESLHDRINLFNLDCTLCGENIMAGYPLNAYDFTDGWYNSEGHRRNMLNSSFEEMGVAISYNSSSDYLYYATQNLSSNI